MTPRSVKPVVMHVLHTLRPAGAEVLVRNLVAAHRRRFDHVVVALDEGGSLQAELEQLGAAVYVLDRRPGIDRRTAAALRSLAAQHRADIIHAHQYTPFFYAALARMTGGVASRIIFTEHGRHYPDTRRLPRRIVNRLLLHRMADRITAVGHFVKRALVHNDGIPAARVEVIHNGIDPALFAPGPTRRLSFRGPLILQVGGFRPVKDHATALLTLAKLHAMGCPATLAFAGNGPTQPLIRDEARRMGLEPYTHFLGNRSDIAALWHAADAGLLTSLSEGVSVALLEAGAAGRPVVATDVGGNSEIILDGVTGRLAPRGDADGLAAALHELLTNPGLAEGMGRAACDRVRAEFNQQRMHAGYLGLYADALAAQRGGRRVA